MIALLLTLSRALGDSPSCTDLERWLPEEMECQQTATLAPADFRRAPGSNRFGVGIQMQVSRGGAPFRTVPLSTPVCSGDSVSFTITPSGRGFLQVLNHGTTGAWSALYPPAGTQPAPFSPDAPLRLPRATDAGYPLSGPAGQEYVLFFVAPSRFSGLLQRELDRLLLRNNSAGSPRRLVGEGERAFLLLNGGEATTGYAVGSGEQRIVVALDHRAACGSLPD